MEWLHPKLCSVWLLNLWDGAIRNKRIFQKIRNELVPKKRLNELVPTHGVLRASRTRSERAEGWPPRLGAVGLGDSGTVDLG